MKIQIIIKKLKIKQKQKSNLKETEKFFNGMNHKKIINETEIKLRMLFS